MPRTAKNWQKPNANERRPPIYILQRAIHETRYTEANASNNTGSAVLAPHGALGYQNLKISKYQNANFAPRWAPRTPNLTLRNDFLVKIQFYSPKRPLRDAFLAQNTILCPKGPCGTHFYSKILFYPPKRSLRDDFLSFPKRNIWHSDRNSMQNLFRP